MNATELAARIRALSPGQWLRVRGFIVIRTAAGCRYDDDGQTYELPIDALATYLAKE